jgi:hypothetical protein
MTSNEVMIDIETMSTEPNAAILTIGAIKFSKNNKIKPFQSYDKFYVRITKESCQNINCHYDSNTENWWRKQSAVARYEAIENPDRVGLGEALYRLSEWIGNSKIIWANSPNFDCVILENAYKKYNLDIPWKFWNLRDVRTLLHIANIRKHDLPDNTQHHALHDCYRQIVGVRKAIINLYT